MLGGIDNPFFFILLWIGIMCYNMYNFSKMENKKIKDIISFILWQFALLIAEIYSILWFIDKNF